MQRVSDYEMIYPLLRDGAHSLLVNGLYGAYDVVDAAQADTVKRAMSDPSALASLDAGTLERLTRRGHVVGQSSEEERENVRIISRLYWLLAYQYLVDLVILPTYNCNFRCEYCFERNRLEKGAGLLAQVMSRETADAIFNQMRVYKERGRKLKSCILYGGEPLLAANRGIVEYICDKCRELDMRLSCVSNGYELDKFIAMITEHNFDFVQITVDGIGAEHDKRRFLAGGQGSYERIMANVAMALERGITIDLRINVNRANLKSAMALRDEFERRGFTKYRNFRYYYKATIACFEDDPANAITDAELFDELYACGICSDTSVRASRVFSDIAGRVSRAFDFASYPPLSPAHCGAESNMLVVDPGGTLYACWDVVSMEEYSIGFTDVESGRFMFNFAFPKWRNRTVDMMDDCIACPFLMNCGGGCAIESEHACGSITRGTCGSVKEAFRRVAPAMCENEFNKSGRRELSRSLYDLCGNLSPQERKTLLNTTSQVDAHAILTSKIPDGVRFFG